MRPRRLSRCLAVAASLALIGTIAACGSDASNAPAGSNAPESNTESSAPPEDENKLKGAWAAQPGQAEKIAQTLSAKGFECTKHATKQFDLRMCAKSILRPAAEYNPEGEYTQRLRFISDGQGTVVEAAIDGTASRSSENNPGMELRKQVEEALLPPADAAILAAKGTKLTWGMVTEEQGVRYLTVKGGEGPDLTYFPTPALLPVTKEQAFPTLQAAQLTCQFTDTTKWGAKQSALTCKDPSFKPASEDGSIGGATAEAILVDEGQGITSLSMEGSHTRGTNDVLGVKGLLPKVFTITKEQDMPEVKNWIDAHLDGLSHSAYIGNWLVNINVVKESMLGSSVLATVGPEKSDFGATS